MLPPPGLGEFPGVGPGEPDGGTGSLEVPPSTIALATVIAAFALLEDEVPLLVISGVTVSELPTEVAPGSLVMVSDGVVAIDVEGVSATVSTVDILEV